MIKNASSIYHKVKKSWEETGLKKFLMLLLFTLILLSNMYFCFDYFTPDGKRKIRTSYLG